MNVWRNEGLRKPITNSCVIILQAMHFQIVYHQGNMEHEPTIDPRELGMEVSIDWEKAKAEADIVDPNDKEPDGSDNSDEDGSFERDSGDDSAVGLIVMFQWRRCHRRKLEHLMRTKNKMKKPNLKVK